MSFYLDKDLVSYRELPEPPIRIGELVVTRLAEDALSSPLLESEHALEVLADALIEADLLPPVPTIDVDFAIGNFSGWWEFDYPDKKALARVWLLREALRWAHAQLLEQRKSGWVYPIVETGWMTAGFEVGGEYELIDYGARARDSLGSVTVLGIGPSELNIDYHGPIGEDASGVATHRRARFTGEPILESVGGGGGWDPSGVYEEALLFSDRTGFVLQHVREQMSAPRYEAEITIPGDSGFRVGDQISWTSSDGVRHSSRIRNVRRL